MAQSRDANAAIHSPASTTVQYATAFKSTHVRDHLNRHLRSVRLFLQQDHLQVSKATQPSLCTYLSKSICHTFLSNHLYKHHDLSKHLFIQFESQQGTIFQFDGIFWCDCGSQTMYTLTYTSTSINLLMGWS